MKLLTTLLFTLVSLFGYSQNQPDLSKPGRKGEFYIYWGWNVSAYSKSDISFKGADYDFTLDNVVAKHRPTPLSVNKYLNPLNITIPQYNFRLGYFFKDNYNISFGFDHMKYDVQQDQKVIISGYINDTETIYNGVYDNDEIALAEEFLELEHTDGLNYLNLELRRQHEFYARKNLQINALEGLGAGILVPRTDATLLSKRQHDKFHLAGYGVGAVVGLNASIRRHFFIQTEFKTGFINMPWIRTTYSKVDEASQNFFFYEINLVFGATINLKKGKY
jgi:hypothetical protein